MSDVETKSRAAWWWTFPVHQLAGTIGIAMVAAFLTATVLPLSRARWILTETPYFPVQIVLALCAGFVLRRVLRHAAMQWVWVLPLLVLFVAFIRTDGSFAARLNRYFGWGCRPELRCFDQLGITLPLYAAAAYSLGAYVAGYWRTGRPGSVVKRRHSSEGITSAGE